MTDQSERHILEALISSAPLTPEFRLLLDCTLILPALQETRYAVRAKALCSATGDGAIDWNIFMGLVDRHHVPALVCNFLCRFAWSHVPDDIKIQLKGRDRKTRLEALKHTAELVRLGRLFSANGIELLPYKGPALSIDLYGDPGLRQSGDLDILVQPDDLDQADHILLNEGYHRLFPDFDLTARQKQALKSADQHYIYRHPLREIDLELHWRLALWTPSQVMELWNHSRATVWSGERFRQLDNEMLILVLCDHGSYHRWFRVKWLSDIAALFSRYAMDWTQLIEMAGRLDLRRSLAQAALLVHWLYEIPLDNPLLTLINQEKTAIRQARLALKAMFISEAACNNPSFQVRWKDELYYMELRTSHPYRFFLQRICVGTTEAWKFFPIPDRLFWLYYFLSLPVWFWRRFMKS